MMENPYPIELANAYIKLGQIYMLDKNTIDKSYKLISDAINILI